jgi:hypothetical protein
MAQYSNKKAGIVVRLALTPAEVGELGSHGRTVPSEIVQRLRGGAAPPSPSPFAGWPASDAADFQAVGDAVAHLFAEVTQRAGTSTTRKRRLGLLRPVVMALLDELGAEDIDSETAAYFDRIARDRIHDEPHKTWAAHLGASRDEGALSKIARQLGADPKPKLTTSSDGSETFDQIAERVVRESMLPDTPPDVLADVRAEIALMLAKAAKKTGTAKGE